MIAAAARVCVARVSPRIREYSSNPAHTHTLSLGKRARSIRGHSLVRACKPTHLRIQHLCTLTISLGVRARSIFYRSD
jgi:hypothetical protein